MVDRKKVIKALNNVLDPEVGVSITDMELIDEVRIEGSEVTVVFHFTTPVCPPMMVMKMANDIKAEVMKVEGVKNVKITASGHLMADKINKEINSKKV